MPFPKCVLITCFLQHKKRCDYDVGFTLSTYTHATEGMKRDAADTIGSVISQTM